MNISLPHQSDMHAACKLVFLELRINHSRPRLSASVTKAHIRFLCCLGWISVVLHIDFPSRLPDKLTIMLMWSTNENEPCYIDYKIAILVLMFSQPHPDKPMPDHPNQSLQSSSCCRVPWCRRQKFGRRSFAFWHPHFSTLISLCCNYARHLEVKSTKPLLSEMPFII